MHFRDLLNCTPPTPGAQGISRTMRYFNTAGELFYTIHADDIRIWKTKAYYDVSRRLDLESIRAVEEGEEAVMPEKHDFGDEPMVWNLVNAEFSICSTHSLPNHQLSGAEWVKPYHSIPLSLLSPNGKTPGAPPSLLVTLTYTGPEDEEHDTSAPQRLLDLQAEAVKHLKSDYADDGAEVWTSVYRHIPDAQPDMHPVIAEGAHGKGGWVVCILTQGEVNEEMHINLQVGLTDLVDKKMRTEGSLRWDVKVGVWRGEVFMC